MSKYEVGTILWIIHKDRPGLVAYRIIEEITKKTLEGEKIQYIVQPAIPKAKPVYSSGSIPTDFNTLG